MRRRVTALALGLVLGLSALTAPVLAAGTTAEKFPAVNDYAKAQYADVPAGAWYADEARVCYETGLITGTDRGFEPDRTMTVGEAAAIAARIREAFTGEKIVLGTPKPGETIPWYQWYVDYLDRALIAVPKDVTAKATRQQFFDLLAAVVPTGELQAINSITALPDTDNVDVLTFYNAGILTGTDAYGTFHPEGTLDRAQCAAMVARIVRPDQRVPFTPAVKPAAKPADPAPTLTYEEELLGTMALMINGKTVTFRQYFDYANQIIADEDEALIAQGKRLDWSAVNLTGLQNAVYDHVLDSVVLAQQASAMGVNTTSQMAAKLNPSPTADDIRGYLYRAKHILIADKTAAETVLAALKANPSAKTFEALLDAYNEDPGMKSNPDGYLFLPGEMVEPFENAVKSLTVGNVTSELVPSQFGYHIIRRLDAATHPDAVSTYQSKKLDDALDSWVASSTVTPNEAMLDTLTLADFQKYYDQSSYKAQLDAAYKAAWG